MDWVGAGVRGICGGAVLEARRAGRFVEGDLVADRDAHGGILFRRKSFLHGAASARFGGVLVEGEYLDGGEADVGVVLWIGFRRWHWLRVRCVSAGRADQEGLKTSSMLSRN